MTRELGDRMVADDRFKLLPFTGIPSVGWRMKERAGKKVGGVIVNDVPTYRIDHMPYGGVKDSGQGREGLRWAMEDMTEIRIMVLAQPG